MGVARSLPSPLKAQNLIQIPFRPAVNFPFRFAIGQQFQLEGVPRRIGPLRPQVKFGAAPVDGEVNPGFTLALRRGIYFAEALAVLNDFDKEGLSGLSEEGSG